MAVSVLLHVMGLTLPPLQPSYAAVWSHGRLAWRPALPTELVPLTGARPKNAHPHFEALVDRANAVAAQAIRELAPEIRWLSQRSVVNHVERDAEAPPDGKLLLTTDGIRFYEPVQVGIEGSWKDAAWLAWISARLPTGTPFFSRQVLIMRHLLHVLIHARVQRSTSSSFQIALPEAPVESSSDQIEEAEAMIREVPASVMCLLGRGSWCAPVGVIPLGADSSNGGVFDATISAIYESARRHPDSFWLGLAEVAVATLVLVAALRIPSVSAGRPAATTTQASNTLA